MEYTEEQLKEMRKEWDIPENYIPVAVAPGVIAWAKKLEEKNDT